MNISPQVKLSVKANVTPSVPQGSGSYSLGFDNQEISIPSTADQLITRTLATATGGKVYEPDINSHDSEGTQPNAELGAVSIDTVYAVVLKNNDAAIAITAEASSGDLGSFSHVIPPGGYLVLVNESGWTIDSDTTITLTSASGTPTAALVLVGESAA